MPSDIHGSPYASPMSVDRLAELADRHGANLATWPAGEAAAARVAAAASPEARHLLARARRLDAVLGEAPSIRVPAGLRARILAAAPANGWRGFSASLWPFGPVWRPAAGLVAIALLGVVLGFSVAPAGLEPVSVNGALSEEVQVLALATYAEPGDLR